LYVYAPGGGIIAIYHAKKHTLQSHPRYPINLSGNIEPLPFYDLFAYLKLPIEKSISV
jgi:hypothetical protein